MYIILIAAALAVVCSLLSRAYLNGWSEKLGVSLVFSSDGVFEGERGEVIETLTNQKLLPVFWGTLQFKTSYLLRFDGSSLDHDYYMQNPLSAFSYEEVTRRLPFTAERRGYYKLSDARLVGGDLLFSYKLIRRFPVTCEIFVYPRVKDVGRFNIDFKKIIGETTARRNLVEDPFFFRGIRDYYPFDSMKTVNWNATARTGSLKVNQYQCTHSQEVMLLLDLDGYNKWDGQQIKEDTIRIAALLAQKLTKTGIATGLATNAADATTGGKIETDCKSGQNHYLYLLREMAKLDTDRLLTPFDSILDNLPRMSGSRPQYILISYYTGDDLAHRVSQLEAAGLSLQWIVLKDKSRKNDFVKRGDMYVCEVEY
jgi:uncharacterized protein (DUF58 family)